MWLTLTNLRTKFKKYVWDSTISNADCDTYLTDVYVNAYQLVWNEKCRYELPLTITKMTLARDADLGYYLSLPATTMAWSFPTNQELKHRTVSTNYQIFVAKATGTVIVEYLPQVSYLTVSSIYTDILDEIIARKAAIEYFGDNRDPESEVREEKRMKDAISQLNQKYAQQFIYNENDWDEEIQVNI